MKNLSLFFASFAIIYSLHAAFPVLRNSNGHVKAIAVEAGKTAILQDFYTFPPNGTAYPRNDLKVSLSRDEKFLRIKTEAFVSDRKKIAISKKNNDPLFHLMGNPWRNDRVCIFFGNAASGSRTWLRQLVAGLGGQRFDSSGSYDSWSSKCNLTATGWEIEVTIPLAELTFDHMSCFFNISINRHRMTPAASWSNLRSFHEFENYGLLLLNSYKEAFRIFSGFRDDTINDRKSFEERFNKLARHAKDLEFGPVLLNPTPRSMSIVFKTNGPCAGLVMYRKKGTSRWSTIQLGKRDNMRNHTRQLHLCHLQDLEPDTVYEYRCLTSMPRTRKNFLQKAGEFRTFPEKSHAFSALIASDSHSDPYGLSQLVRIKKLKGLSFIANVGDMVSEYACDNFLFESVIQPQVKLFNGTVPLIFARGNHEFSGLAAHNYYRLLAHPSGNTWFHFQKGDVLFVVLDSAGYGGFPQLMATQKKYLAQLAKTSQWKNAKFRIALVHLPPAEYYMDKLFGDVGKLTPDKGGFDLLICGHHHRYQVLQPNTKTQFKRYAVSGVPFPVIINGSKTAILMKREKDQLLCDVLNFDGSLLKTWNFPIRVK